LKIISEEKPSRRMKRMRWLFPSRVVATLRYCVSRNRARAFELTLAVTRLMSSSLTPFALRSWRMRAAPYLRDSERPLFGESLLRQLILLLQPEIQALQIFG